MMLSKGEFVLEEIRRMFVYGNAFSREWKTFGLGDEDLRRLENSLLRDPKIGDVIRGTGRMRKMRFALPYRGKRGSVRVCYVDFEEYEVTYLITAFIKNKQANLSASEKNILRQIVKALKGEASKKGDDTDE